MTEQRQWKRELLVVMVIVFAFITSTSFYLHYTFKSFKPFPVTLSNRRGGNYSTAAADKTRCVPAPLHFGVNDSVFTCDWQTSLPPPCKTRLRAKLVCSKLSVGIVYEWVPADAPPSVYAFDDDCLARAVKSLCFRDGDGGKKIPSVAHHVFFGGKKMTDYAFLSVVSAVRYLQPCLVMVHADKLPTGPYWRTLLVTFPVIIHVTRPAPSHIFGRPVKVIEHSSDIARLEAVMRFGGVYLDADYVLLNPVEGLRHHAVVMGQTIPNTNYCNCIFMGAPQAQFLRAWYESYRSFDDSVWGYHSTIMPFLIHRHRPELPFHEVNTFVTPYFKKIKQVFYDGDFDFTRVHGLHLYVRFFRRYFDGRLERKNGSLGKLARRVLFGDSEACYGRERPRQVDIVRSHAEYPLN